MRLMTWNCRVGAFRRKAGKVAPMRPDILVVQEVEPLKPGVIFDGDRQPTFADRVADPAYPRRAIGVFSYTGLELRAEDTADPMYCFRRYAAVHTSGPFQVVAVWTAKTTERATSYRQAHEGLRRHADWIRQHPTVVLGDFNASASYDGKAWAELLRLTEGLDLVSAYHHVTGEPFGAEKQWTHFHKGDEGSKWHIDYCFVPRAWVPKITKVEVGAYAEWRTNSDHVPLTVDLDL